MKKNTMKNITLLFLAFISIAVSGQKIKPGFYYGQSYYIGELNDYHFHTRPHLENFEKSSFGAAIKFQPLLCSEVKFSFMYGYVSGDDSIAEINPERGLHFKSKMLETSLQVQLSLPFDYTEKFFNWEEKIFRLTPYVFTGISYFSFNPMGQYTDGKWYELQPLSTEGQELVPTRDKYKLSGVAIPFGIGFKVITYQNVELEAEWGIRYTFTDYLDDVSTSYYDNDLLRNSKGDMAAYFADPAGANSPNDKRGDSTTKDKYIFAGFTVYYTFEFP